MEQLNGTVTLAYLDEDNKQRIFFRVVPLCTREGYLFADAQARYPDHGSLRIVPDKREQSTFKDRMRDIGALCAICLSGDAKEVSKVRQNKNYQPQQGEYNQFAIYSDVVCGFEKDALFEVLACEDGQVRQGVAPLTEQVLLLNHKVLYGPVEAAALASVSIAELKPYGNDHYLLHTVKLPDQTQHTLYWNPEAIQNKRLKKAKTRDGKEAPALETAAPAEPAEVPTPQPEVIREETPVAVPETARTVEPEKEAAALPLPAGPTPQILDMSLSFDAHLERLSQPVSLDANLLDSAPAEPEPEEAVHYTGTPLASVAVRPPQIVGSPKPLHYVVERQLKAVRPSRAEVDLTDLSVEQALPVFLSIWQNPESRVQMMRALAANESFCTEFSKMLHQSGKERILLAAAQAQLADIEAERLSLLMQLERLQGDRRKQEQETLQALTAQRKAKLTELEGQIADLEAQKTRLEGATVALSEAAQTGIESFIRTHTWHGQPYDESIALFVPMVGTRRSLTELLDMLRKGLTRAGFSISEDDAYQLLFHFALSDELCLYGENARDARQFCKAFVRALGLDKVSALASKESQVRVVDCLAENDCRTPLVLITELSARGLRLAGQKTLMYTSAAEYLAGNTPAAPDCPKVRIPALSKALPEDAAAPEIQPAIALSSLDELQAAVAPLLDEQETWFVELERGLEGVQLSESTLRDMRRFVSAAGQKLRGGFIAAADAAVCHWIVPLVVRQGGLEGLAAQLACLPKSLALLRVNQRA